MARRIQLAQGTLPAGASWAKGAFSPRLVLLGTGRAALYPAPSGYLSGAGGRRKGGHLVKQVVKQLVKQLVKEAPSGG